MGAMKRLAEAKRAKATGGNGKGGGSSLLNKLHHTDGPPAQGGATWDDVPDGLISWLVRKVSNEGGLATFGATRDGGALKLSIWHGGVKHDEYFSAQADIGMAVWSFALRLQDDEEVGPEQP